MQIDPNLKRSFPKLERWIHEVIPGVRFETRILEPFMRYAQLDVDQARLVLDDNGLAPTIDFAVMRSYGEYRGEIRKRHLDKVLIQRKLCRLFERGQADYRGAAIELILKASILHEMVHWGDYKADGWHQPDRDVYDQVHDEWLRDADVGFQFEEEAFYGIYTKEYL